MTNERILHTLMTQFHGKTICGFDIDGATCILRFTDTSTLQFDGGSNSGISKLWLTGTQTTRIKATLEED
jgi:hypothetical protein